MIRARMRSDASWHDVCVLNISLHGLGIQSANPPARGSYVEICRGRQAVIARVAWSKGHRAGLRSQDPIFIQALISDTRPATPGPANGARQVIVERRHAPRPSARAHDNSRIKARAVEFASFGVIAAALAVAAVSTVNEALSKPFTAIGAALDPPQTLPEQEGKL